MTVMNMSAIGRARAPISAAARIDGQRSVSRSTKRSTAPRRGKLAERGYRLEPQIRVDCRRGQHA